jgi:hypothetical protein
LNIYIWDRFYHRFKPQTSGENNFFGGENVSPMVLLIRTDDKNSVDKNILYSTA